MGKGQPKKMTAAQQKKVTAAKEKRAQAAAEAQAWQLTCPPLATLEFWLSSLSEDDVFDKVERWLQSRRSFLRRVVPKSDSHV